MGVLNVFKSMLISIEPEPPKEESAENKENEQNENEKNEEANSKASEDKTDEPKEDAQSEKDKETDIPPPPSTGDVVIESVDENEIVITKEVVVESKAVEEAPKDPY